MIVEDSSCHLVNVSSLLQLQDPGSLLVCSPPWPAYDQRRVEGDPMIYIVVMLFVFSAGIASLMIIYMKKVKFSINSEASYVCTETSVITRAWNKVHPKVRNHNHGESP